MPRAAVVVIAAMGVLLGGCFLSEKPMFDASTAVSALGEGGRYASIERFGESYRPSNPVEIKRREDGAYDFVNDEGAKRTISLHRLNGDRHAGQVRSSTGGFGYVVFRFDGNEVLLYGPECQKQDRRKLATLGVDASRRDECRIDRVRDPAALFAEVTLGEPLLKLMRE